MNNIKTFLLINAFFGLFVASEVKAEEKQCKPFERRMVIFSAGRNNAKYYKKTLDSIFNQTYDNYRVVYVDDCSEDGTGELVAEYIKEKGMEDKVQLIINEERQYKMANQYYAIHEFCDDSDIVVELDADDWFAHDNVLSYLNEVYSDPNVWMTYSKYKYHPLNSARRWCKPVSKKILKNKNYRRGGFIYMGLRTFYAGLFKLIKKEDLMYRGKNKDFHGKFTPITSDASIMYPMLEMCHCGHFKFLTDVLCFLNRDRDEGKTYNKAFLKMRRERVNVLGRMKKYPALKEPLWEINLRHLP